MKKPYEVGQKIKFVGPVIRGGYAEMWAIEPLVAFIEKTCEEYKLAIMCEGTRGYICARQVTHRIIPKKRREIWVREYPEEWQEFKEGQIVKVDIANHYARSGSHWRCFQEVRK